MADTERLCACINLPPATVKSWANRFGILSNPGRGCPRVWGNDTLFRFLICAAIAKVSPNFEGLDGEIERITDQVITQGSYDYPVIGGYATMQLSRHRIEAKIAEIMRG